MEGDWLFKKEEYIPLKDKDKFLDKSIIAIVSFLGRIKRDGGFSKKKFYKINGTVKLLCTLINVVLLSLSRSFIFVLLLDFYLLFSTCLLEREDRKKVLMISLLVPVFTIMMLIPAFLSGNIKNSLLIVVKVSGSILSVNILSYSTKWVNITKALKLLFIPDIFIWIMEITIKYIVLLGEYSLNFLYALKLRSVGRNNNKYVSLSSIVGNLFLKSKEMGEEMFSAMECRGFTGEYKSSISLNLKHYDYIYFTINLLIMIGFICIK